MYDSLWFPKIYDNFSQSMKLFKIFQLYFHFILNIRNLHNSCIRNLLKKLKVVQPQVYKESIIVVNLTTSYLIVLVVKNTFYIPYKYQS